MFDLCGPIGTLVTVRLLTITRTIKARGATNSNSRTATAEQLKHGVLVVTTKIEHEDGLLLLIGTKQQQQTLFVFDLCGPIETPCSMGYTLAAYVVRTWP